MAGSKGMDIKGVDMHGNSYRCRKYYDGKQRSGEYPLWDDAIAGALSISASEILDLAGY